MTRDSFVLQFDPSEIQRLAEKFVPEQDDEALAAGKAIADGNYSKHNLNVIIRWKVGHPWKEKNVSLVDKNTDDEVTSALRFASGVGTSEKYAVETLYKLNGVGIPVASAILAMINPERYTIIDVRALESLGVSKSEDTIDYYLAYLQKCRELSREYKVSLRTLDRALWKWSELNGKGSGACS
jgi:thermostable 8-oxoguanine DNA glycosylase